MEINGRTTWEQDVMIVGYRRAADGTWEPWRGTAVLRMQMGVGDWDAGAAILGAAKAWAERKHGGRSGAGNITVESAHGVGRIR